MGWFRKKRERSLSKGQVEVAGRIATALLDAQRRSALWLNTKASTLNPRVLKLILLLMGLGFALGFGWMIIGALL
ncbi:MAG: hypothetical protein EOO90_03575 [Pedobacter sp.]|nr:MAG: hypothetical protein EOO90_03575 [Pedobacter sp.]